MGDNKHQDVKPDAADTTAPSKTGAKERVIRPAQGTDKVASEAEEVAELGDELGGPA